MRGDCMLSKSERTRRFILEKSREVFMEKGFQDVTMTDIVDACDISRGGLYRYFKSTRDIFLEILHIEQVETDVELSHAAESGLPAPTILESFLQEQKEELLHKEKSLTVAAYEFFFMYKDQLEENMLQRRFNAAEKILSTLIQYGIDRKEFHDVDKHAAAKHIILLLEGVRISSEVMHITEELLDEQFDFIKKMLVHDGAQ